MNECKDISPIKKKGNAQRWGNVKGLNWCQLPSLLVTNRKSTSTYQFCSTCSFLLHKINICWFDVCQQQDKTIQAQEDSDFHLHCHHSLFMPFTEELLSGEFDRFFSESLGCAVLPVHVVFHISTTILGSFVRLRRHVDDCSAHLCGLGPRAFTDGQLAPLWEAKICNLNSTKAEQLHYFDKSHTEAMGGLSILNSPVFVYVCSENIQKRILPLFHVLWREIHRPAECFASSGPDGGGAGSYCEGNWLPGRSRTGSSASEARRARGTNLSVDNAERHTHKTIQFE